MRSRLIKGTGHASKGTGARATPAPITVAGDQVWEFSHEQHAAPIAAAVEVGDLVYAPPREVPTRRPDGTTWIKQVVPDLTPLRAALAARGLQLVIEGAFYFRVAPPGRRAQAAGHAG